MRRFSGVVLSVLAGWLLVGSFVWTAPPASQAAASYHNFSTSLTGLNRCGSGNDGPDFTLAAVGDILLHMYIQNVAEQNGYDYLFDQVRPFLQAADLTYANFEGNANPNAPRSEFPNFNYNPVLAVALKNAGVDVVSTANNHAIDTGPAGVDATLDSLDKAGLLHHGTTRRDETPAPYQRLTFTKNGVSVKAAFLSYTFSTNGIPDPYHQVNMLWGTDGHIAPAVKAAIAQARQEIDFVIVAVHWGVEYQTSPNDQQRQGAQELANAGADVILGDHPHTVQPVDELNANGRKALVIYSLGNFVAAQAERQATAFTQTSLIYYVGFSRRSNGRVEVTGYRYLPVYIENDVRPVPLQPGSYGDAYGHILTQMRDPGGNHAVSLDPAALLGGVPLCPSTFFPATGQSLSGDFYQYFYTLGSGSRTVPPEQALAVIGYPIGPSLQELSGDCTHYTTVLYTERQRLEWQPEADWPYRIVGTQLGTAIYQAKFGLTSVPRLTNLTTALTNSDFRAFFETYGGLTVFGYPISTVITEYDKETGLPRTVQYFERVRFELNPTATNPLYRVQLGLLSREYAALPSLCAK